MIRIVAVAFLLALGGCAPAIMALGAAASLSTLLKNEANCSLADVASCTLPRLAAPAAAP